MRYRLLLLMPLALLLAGCWVTLGDIHNVALFQSDDQRLIVTNTTSGPLTIAGAPPGPPIALAAGQSITVPFRVATLGSLQPPAGEPYWTIDPAGFTETFVELQTPKIVDTSSRALALNFHDARGVLVKASFALSLCRPGAGWAKQHIPSADHAVLVPDPIPAVPQAVCP